VAAPIILGIEVPRGFAPYLGHATPLKTRTLLVGDQRAVPRVAIRAGEEVAATC
jgi:hypothetical protein